MEWIPAVDLKDELVVRATGENRHDYQPLSTTLFPQADAYTVVHNLMRFRTFTTIYLADLNALIQSNHNYNIICRLVADFPLIQFWVDAGLRCLEDYFKLRSLGNNIVPIIATETFPDIKDLSTLSRQDYILSLDFKNQTLLGNPDFLHASHCWPERVLVLSLDAIGRGKPDYAALENVTSRNVKQCKIVLGGGIRTQQDIAMLEGKNISGCVLGSALYDGKLLETNF